MPRGPGFGRARRGVSEVLGAILVFAILIAAVGVFQVTVVPQTNEEVEFKHSEQVRGQMGELRSAAVTVGTDGTSRSVSVSTGTTYQTWSTAVNPSDPSGQLSTRTVPDAVELDGLTAVDDEAADYWDGDDVAFDSGHVSYRPSYNYYGNAPETRYEPTVLYSTFRNGQVVESQQSLVSGRTLNLVFVDGELSSGGRDQTVDVNPVSTATGTVTLETTDGDPATLRVRTGITEERWDDLLASNPDASLEDYTVNADAPNVAELELATGRWRLRASLVSLNSPSLTTSPEYVTVAGNTDRTVNPGETTDVTVRTLDRYGNPVEGVTVHRDFGPDRETGEDGTVTYDYTLAASDSTVDLGMWIGGAGSHADATEAERASVTVSTTSPNTGTPDASLINPGNGLVLQGATASDNTATLDFENRNTGTWANVSEIRMNYYHASPPGQGNSLPDPPEEWSSNVTTGQYEIAGPFAPTDGSFDVAPGENGGLEMSIHGGSDVDAGDFFIVSLVFEDGSSRVYFVATQS
ncbi:MAG: hypothetical protein V5A62_04165 [Haloarculaceae archaeon]